MLTLIKQHRNGWYTTGWIAAAVAILMSVIFCKIYLSAPLAQAIAPFPAGLRFFGILWAEIFFGLSNILLQAGISALRIKLTDESELIGLQPFAITKIKNNFTTIGWRSPQLLKFFEEELETNNVVIDSEIASKIGAIAADDSLVKPVLESIETSLDEEIIQEPEELNPFELIEETELEAVLDVVSSIAESEIESILELEIEELEPNEFIAENQENESQDFDDELNELIAFNIYVENILQEYLESEDENSIELETQVSEDITEDVSSNDQATEDPKHDTKYLVQEFLVDKFLARLEELNIADRANKATIEQTTENSSEPSSEADEFADLEALLDGNSLPENLE